MATITQRQVKAVFARLKDAGLADKRHEIILGATENRTYHVAELTKAEYDTLMRYLDANALKKDAAAKPQRASKATQAKALILATELGLLPRVAKGQKISTEGYKAFNEWMLTKSVAKKILPACTAHELGLVIDQLEAWMRDRMRSTGVAISDNDEGLPR
jgi:hypothetical protein